MVRRAAARARHDVVRPRVGVRARRRERRGGLETFFCVAWAGCSLRGGARKRGGNNASFRRQARCAARRALERRPPARVPPSSTSAAHHASFPCSHLLDRALVALGHLHLVRRLGPRRRRAGPVDCRGRQEGGSGEVMRARALALTAAAVTRSRCARQRARLRLVQLHIVWRLPPCQSLTPVGRHLSDEGLGWVGERGV